MYKILSVYASRIPTIPMCIRGGAPKRFIISSATDAASRSGSKGEKSASVYTGEGGQI